MIRTGCPGIVGIVVYAGLLGMVFTDMVLQSCSREEKKRCKIIKHPSPFVRCGRDPFFFFFFFPLSHLIPLVMRDNIIQLFWEHPAR